MAGGSVSLIDLLRGEVPPPKLQGVRRRHLMDAKEQRREAILQAARDRNRVRRQADPEAHRVAAREWQKANPTKATARRLNWVKNNPERAKAMERAASRRYWRKKHGKSDT